MEQAAVGRREVTAAAFMTAIPVYIRGV